MKIHYVVVAILCIILLFIIGAGVTGFIVININDNKEIDMLEDNCDGLDLQDTVYCMIMTADDFYKFNLTDDDLRLPLEELKKHGGDCKDWSEFYGRWAEQLGFDSTYTVIPMNRTWRHEFVTISDETGFCNINMLSYHCYMYV